MAARRIGLMNIVLQDFMGMNAYGNLALMESVGCRIPTSASFDGLC
jgi:hypothetical protein